MPEQSIFYREVAQRTDHKLGLLDIHIFQQTMGVEIAKPHEHSVFLLESEVTTTDVWEGGKLPQRRWEAGDVIFLPANSEVSAPYVSNPYSETMIRIPDPVFQEGARSFDRETIEMRYAVIPKARTIGVSVLVKNIAAMESAPPILVEAATSALTCGIICLLSRGAMAIARQEPKGMGQVRLKRALAFIEANVTRSITLGDMAAAAAMSTFHFSRSFRASMGIPPVRYLWARRVELAKGMLKHTEMPVVAVAMSCGFSSQSHFASAFRMLVGVTPTAFRQRE